MRAFVDFFINQRDNIYNVDTSDKQYRRRIEYSILSVHTEVNYQAAAGLMGLVLISGGIGSWKEVGIYRSYKYPSSICRKSESSFFG